MIYGNASLKAHIVMTGLVIGAVTTVANKVVNCTVAGASFVAGDCVLITPKSATGIAAGAGLSFYGVVVSATVIGLVAVNASAGTITPTATDFDILVFGKQQPQVAGT